MQVNALMALFRKCLSYFLFFCESNFGQHPKIQELIQMVLPINNKVYQMRYIDF